MGIPSKLLRRLGLIAAVAAVLVLIAFCQGGFSTGRYWLYPWERWYLVPQAEDGDVEAARSLRLHYEFHGDKETTRYWLRKGAEYGDPEAQLALFDALKKTRDPSLEMEAKESLQKAADRGYGWAQVQLADEYMDGTLYPRSDEQAEKWLRKACHGGSLAGMDKLSKLLAATHSDQDALTEAYMWTLIGLSRIRPDVALADFFEDTQRAILKRASVAGVSPSSIERSAKDEAARVGKSIRRGEDE